MAAAGVGVYGPGESPGTAEEAFEAVKLAFEAGGGDVNGANKDGETALLGAVYRGGAVPVIQFLADKGARLDAENKKHWTPLARGRRRRVCQQRHPPLSRSGGADPQVDARARPRRFRKSSTSAAPCRW